MTSDTHARGRSTGASSQNGLGMRFSVDAWDPAYGSSLELEDDLGESTARVDVTVELPV